MPFLLLCLPKLQVMDFVSQGSCLDGVLNEPTDMQDGKDLDNSVSRMKTQNHLAPNGRGG